MQFNSALNDRRDILIPIEYREVVATIALIHPGVSADNTFAPSVGHEMPERYMLLGIYEHKKGYRKIAFWVLPVQLYGATTDPESLWGGTPDSEEIAGQL